eukprot:gnl/MRDRNA2_/MRDRNA2_79868_c0_seq1.p1 gnl/MRDRNA2_/MRDRNA2_79868_c0~~gnl/MRDRNA2_/MRDRNA2_79868_c0_seq1.p1  ORF type:complete len:214 (+),score=26.88 gnl/MRDRNA2_/MRDRNA2_79868_c0_seq1:132-773(+)
MIWNMYLNGVYCLSNLEFSGKKPGILPLNRAASSDGHDVILYYRAGDFQQSFTKHLNEQHSQHLKDKVLSWAERELSDINQIQMQSVQVEDYLRDRNTDPVDLFKFDCEGCEYDIMPAMSKFLCNSETVQRVVAELHPSDAHHIIPEKELTEKMMQFAESCGCQDIDEAWLSCDHTQTRMRASIFDPSSWWQVFAPLFATFGYFFRFVQEEEL